MLCSELDHLVPDHAVAITTLREAPAGHQYAVRLHSQLWVAHGNISHSQPQEGPAVCPWLPQSRLQAETLPVAHRAISLVSCRAVAILIMSLRRGIPPSLISRGQYLSAVGR